jgi:hypothetical protein
MIQQFRHRQFPANNPLANALVIIVGVLVIAVSLVLGVVAFIALLAAAIVMAGVIGARGSHRRARLVAEPEAWCWPQKSWESSA